MDPKDTRGYLNNNPGNMDRSEPPWNGEIRDPAQAQNDCQRNELTHGRFCVFVDAVHGYRAMALNLQAYWDKLGYRTISQFIDRWAPPNENNTAAYKEAVAEHIGIGVNDDMLDFKVARPLLMDAITRVECAGMPYDGTELQDGNALAG